MFKRLFFVSGLIIIGMLVLSGALQLNQVKDDSSGLLSSFTELKDKLFHQLNLDKEADPEPLNAFKWQDEEGVWHFGDQAPEDIAAEAIVVKPVKTTTFSQSSMPADTDQRNTASNLGSSSTNIPATPADYMDRSLQLFDDAKQVESMLQEQDDQRRKALEGL